MKYVTPEELKRAVGDFSVIRRGLSRDQAAWLRMRFRRRRRVRG